MLTFIKKHYHWVIAAVMLLEMAVIGGIANNYNGLFLLNVTADLGISRASYSLAYCAKYLFSFISTLFSAYFFLRFGNRIPLIAGLVFEAIGYALLPLSNDIAMLAVANAILGIGDAFCCTAAASRIIGDWFHKHKGTVWGIVSASTGVGGSLFCMLLSGIMETSGWRAGYTVCSITVAAIFLLILILIKSKPGSIGLKPYGMGQIQKIKKTAHDQFAGPTMGELKKKPVFYLGLLVAFWVSFSLYLAYDNVVPHMRDQGLTQAEAVAQQSSMLIYLTVSKILAGLLWDWIGAKATSVGAIAFTVVSMILLAGVSSMTSATLAMISFALALSFVTVLLPMLIYRLYGYRSHGASLAIFMAMPTLGLLIASPTANGVFDAVGSYSPIMLISAGISAAALLLLFVLFFLSKRLEKAEIQQSENDH